MQIILNRVVLAAALILVPATLAQAAQKPLKAPVVTVKPGKASTIHDNLYAWDEKCRPVTIRFKVLQASSGRVYPVAQTYRIKGPAGDACNGRTVSGRKIMFHPAPGFKGSTFIKYSIATPGTAMKDTFVFSRPIQVR